MASVECPRCGARVKAKDGSAVLRCRECGKQFRAPDDEDDDDRGVIRRPARRRSRGSGGTKVALIVVGGLVAAALVGLVVVLIVRGGGSGGDAPRDPSKVTVENFRRVKPGMEPREVAAILGGGRPSSPDDMRQAVRRGVGGLEGEFAAGFETAFAKQSAASEWRLYEGKGVRVWVAFAETKEGRRAAFSTALEGGDGTGKSHNGFMTWGNLTDLDAEAAARKGEDAVRTDPKWVRGPNARGLLVGEWRTADAEGWEFRPDGRLRDVGMFGFATDRPGKEMTYRVLSDAQVETTKPSPFDPPPPGHPAPPITFKPTVQQYEFFVTDEELALIEVTPQAHGPARRYYRMPVKPGGAGYTGLLRPLLDDVKGPDVGRRQAALHRLERLGRGAAAALPELRELRRLVDPQSRPFLDAAVNALSAGGP